MPIQFTAEEIAKVETSLIESDLEVLTFQSGAKIVKKQTNGSYKWVVSIPGYPDVPYDSLGDAYAKTTALTLAIKS